MSKIMLHAGGWQANREQIDAVAVPQATPTYFPVRHGDVIDNVVRAASGYKLEVVGEQYALARDGTQMFGMIDLRSPSDVVDDELGRIGLSAIVRNSYDQSMSIGIGCGTRVFVCDNLALSADWLKTRKHTPNAWNDLYGFLFGSFGTVLAQHLDFKSKRDAWRSALLNTRDSDHLLMECYRKNALVAGDLGNVLREWDCPTVVAWADEPRNAWRLFNSVTQVAKGWSPIMQLERSRKAVDTFCEVLA